MSGTLTQLSLHCGVKQRGLFPANNACTQTQYTCTHVILGLNHCQPRSPRTPPPNRSPLRSASWSATLLVFPYGRSTHLTCRRIRFTLEQGVDPGSWSLVRSFVHASHGAHKVLRCFNLSEMTQKMNRIDKEARTRCSRVSTFRTRVAHLPGVFVQHAPKSPSSSPNEPMNKKQQHQPIIVRRKEGFRKTNKK